MFNNVNQRLQKIYDEISSQNREVFLQNKIVPDINWGKKISGATLQIDLTDQVKDQVQKYQADLITLEPDNLFLTPKSSQHISFNQVVFWNGKYVKGVKATWDEIKDEFTEKFKQLDNLFPTFSITLNRLTAHTSAILWCAIDEHDEMENLRDKLFKILPFPQETLKRNHIIHTTIARFIQKLNNPSQIIYYINQHKENVSMKVTDLVLRYENIYPSLNNEEIARINLV